MKTIQKNFKLKNNKACMIRHASSSDAKEFLEFLYQISNETENTIRYPQEIQMTVEKEALILKSMEQSANQWMLGAYVDNRLVANAHCYGIGNQIKIKHRAGLGISVLKDYWNIGIGSILMREIIEIMTKHGYEQLELDVMGNNDHAIGLYRKFGFVECGRVPHGIRFIDGSYTDLVTMMKVLKRNDA